MAEFPAMPLWTDAYLADTRHLSDAEHGRYLLMLMDMWRAPGCRFPNDRAWLERRFRRTTEQFDAEIQPLLSEFCQCDGNWWTQKKLLKVWKQSQQYHAQQSVRAKARWNKERQASRGNAEPASLRQCNPSPSLKDSESTGETQSLAKHDLSNPSWEVSGAPNGAAHTGNGIAKPKPDPRGTRLPEDWEPGSEGIEYARELGLSAEQIRESYGAFMRHWLAKAGAQGRKLRWDLTWQTWIRNDHAKIREKAERERRFAEGRVGAR